MANLSAMLVDKPLNQFKEAFRVLQPGCSAAFTIWGRRAESLMMNHIEGVLEKHLPAPMVEAMVAEKSAFDLFDGKHFDVEKTLKAIGFSQVKMWLQAQNVMFRNGQEYMKYFEGKFKRICTKAGFDEQKMDELHALCISEFDKVSGAGTPDLKTFQVQVIVCWKA